MLISVIIPTYKDWEGLAICLSALEKQTFSKEDFEVIVVNNNADDALPESIVLPPNSQFFVEKKKGSYAARNLGIKHSSGEILAFTDSDCNPNARWLEEGYNLFSKNEKLERVGGKIDLSYQSSVQSPVEIYESVYAFDQKDNVRKGLSVTANLFVKKTAFSKYGLFPDDLFSGGDFQWNRKANAGNSEIIYSDKARVSHPARSSFNQLRKKAKRVAGGQSGQAIRKINPLKAVGILLWEFRPPIFEWKKIAKANHLNFYDKVRVWWIRYWFRTIKAWEQFKIAGMGKELSNT